MPLSASLARGVASAAPGTLHARTVTGELSAPPRQGLTVRFGRGEEPDVDLGVGVDDLRVSRRHGEGCGGCATPGSSSSGCPGAGCCI